MTKEFDSKFTSGKIREKHILKELKNLNLNVNIYENILGEDDFGGFKINQNIIVNKKTYKCPDVQIFQTPQKTSVIFRVEVKSFKDGTKEYSEQFNNIPVVGIKTYLYKSYLKLKRQEEVNCMLMFVLGEQEFYDYHWEYLSNLENIKSNIGNLYDKNPKVKDGTFWRISDLKHGLKSFLSEVQYCVNNY